MKIVAKIYLVLSFLSVLSGIGYLAVGYTQNYEKQEIFNPISGWFQIVLALLTLVLAIVYLKGNEKVKNILVVCVVCFSMFLTYTIYF